MWLSGFGKYAGRVQKGGYSLNPTRGGGGLCALCCCCCCCCCAVHRGSGIVRVQLTRCRIPPMKTSVGCIQHAHSILRRWIGGAPFTPRSNRAGQPVLLFPNGSISTAVRIELISTPRSTPTSRNVATYHMIPTSSPLPLGDTRLRRLSGSGRIAAPDERATAARARLESKPDDAYVDVAPPLGGAPIDLDDLQDLNAEIAGFVGSLGDPDFDAQGNAPTTSPATDRRHDDDHQRTG